MIIRLNNVRVVYLDIWQPKKQKDAPADAQPKYGLQGHILKTDVENIEKFKQAMKDAAKDKFGASWESEYQAIVAQHRIALRDGVEKPKIPGMADVFFFNASRAQSKGRPRIVGKDGKDLPDNSGVIYSGCYANLNLDIWAQKRDNGNRINCALEGLQFFAEGDAFGGGSSGPAPDFDDLSQQGDTSVNAFM